MCRCRQRHHLATSIERFGAEGRCVHIDLAEHVQGSNQHQIVDCESRSDRSRNIQASRPPAWAPGEHERKFDCPYDFMIQVVGSRFLCVVQGTYQYPIQTHNHAFGQRLPETGCYDLSIRLATRYS